MSYILDALRRADAERERGAVPGLQSQQHAYVEDDAARPRRPRLLVWAVAALAVIVIAALAWNLGRGGGSSPAQPVIEGSVSPAPSAAPVPPPTPPAAPPTLVPSPATAALPTPASTPTPTPTSPPPRTAAAPTPDAGGSAAGAIGPTIPKARPAKPPPEPKRVARRPAEAGPSTPAGESKATGAAGEARVYQQSELPEDVRRDLPKLVIGGASYSGDAASRMVMINGQIFHEGDQLSPQLVLERIKLKSAVLSYKGYRYEVTF
jgi:general secretion pathway protein B